MMRFWISCGFDRVVERLAHPQVIELVIGAVVEACGLRLKPIMTVRRSVRSIAFSPGWADQARKILQRRILGEVDLARQQRGDACRG